MPLEITSCHCTRHPSRCFSQCILCMDSIGLIEEAPRDLACRRQFVRFLPMVRRGYCLISALQLQKHLRGCKRHTRRSMVRSPDSHLRFLPGLIAHTGAKQARLYPIIINLTVMANAYAIFGKDLARNEEFTSAALRYVEDTLKTAEIVRLVPKWAAPYVKNLLGCL